MNAKNVVTASIPIGSYFNKSGLGHSGGVNENYNVFFRDYGGGIGAASNESLADAVAKNAQAHALAAVAQTVADYLNAASLADQAAQEASDLFPNVVAIGTQAATADAQYHLIADNSASISVSDANTAAVAAIQAADGALLSAAQQPSPSPSPSPTNPGTTTTSTPMSTSTKVALGVVAASAIAAGGYVMWKNMKRGRR